MSGTSLIVGATVLVVATGTSDDKLAALIAGISFVIYVGGLVLASLRQIARFFAYWKGWVIRHDFLYRGPRSGVWRRDTLDGRQHNHWFPMWIEHIEPSPVPDLLKRDIWFTLGIAWPFLLILIARVLISLNWLDSGAIAMNATWYLITGAPAALAVLAYTYYEWFRVERIDVEQERRAARAENLRMLSLEQENFDLRRRLAVFERAET